jgi:dethiobiotin synthetase
MNQTPYFISAIDTDVGKTIVSAILVEALKADYWKPIQAGNLEDSDTMTVQSLISNSTSQFYSETYRLNTPASPHYAAEIDGLQLEAHSIQLPKTSNQLIVEGAGGLFVPINDKALLIDLMQDLNIPVILVIKNYLGSINHSLSSIYALQQKDIPIKGLIFNGPSVASSEDYILQYSKLPLIAKIPELSAISKQTIREQAERIKLNLSGQ